jgi:uncharacterized protein YecT (DUF1311 family)
MRLKLIGAAMAVAIASPATATNAAVQACFDKLTGGEQKECMAEVQRAARAELEATFRAVLDTARRSDASRAAAIEAAQTTWQAYRDAECGLIGGGTRGSGTAIMVMGCYAEKDFERARELKVPFSQR